MLYLIQCIECDSEYHIEYEQGMLSDDIQYCSICNAKVDPELISEEE